MFARITLITLLCGLAAATFEYEGFKVYQTVTENQEQADFLNEVSKESEEYDFWTLSRIPKMEARVMVPPKLQEEFEENLAARDFKYEVIIPDVSKTIKKERMENQLMRRYIPRGISFTQYHRFNEINDYLDTLGSRYSSFVKVEEVGKSSEGRPIKTITITNGDGRTDKQVVFVDAGIHAREWIAPAEALYIIHQLVEKHEENMDLLKNFDWIILPVVNPDGYEYTHTGKRLWRKTRGKNPSSSCLGTDANRNFDFHWSEIGSSASACSETYHGTKPFSEPEAVIIRDLLTSLKGRCTFYLTLHSFGNYLLYPWGWTDALPETWKDLDEVSQAGAAAIFAATGSKYTVGSSTNVLYSAAGGSDDYAFGVSGATIAITMELPGGGMSGFDPSPRTIQKSVDETWVGIRAMGLKVDEKFA